MINIKTIKIDEPDFTSGKIYPVPGKDFFFVLDVTRLEMLQLSPSYQTSQRLKLSNHANIKQIDTAFCHEQSLIIVDSISKKFFKLHPGAEACLFLFCAAPALPGRRRQKK